MPSRRIAPWLAGACLAGAIASASSTVLAADPGPDTLPVSVVSIQTNDADEQADSLTKALRSSIRQMPGWSLGEGDYSLEVITLVLKCEPTDATCASRIADQIKADRYVWGVLKKKGPNVIGDLYKTEVYALARYCNELHGTQRIPEIILTKEPSADLAPGQKDTDSLPPYPVLDEILKFYIEGERLRASEYAQARRFVRDLHAQGQADVVQKVLTLVARSEFKRRQAPPIIRVRPRAFGTGRQIPIVAQVHYVPEEAAAAA